MCWKGGNGETHETLCFRGSSIIIPVTQKALRGFHSTSPCTGEARMHYSTKGGKYGVKATHLSRSIYLSVYKMLAGAPPVWRRIPHANPVELFLLPSSASFKVARWYKTAQQHVSSETGGHVSGPCTFPTKGMASGRAYRIILGTERGPVIIICPCVFTLPSDCLLHRRSIVERHRGSKDNAINPPLAHRTELPELIIVISSVLRGEVFDIVPWPFHRSNRQCRP
jgi:hypothetical protein